MLARLRFPLTLLLLAAAACAITYATQRVWRENGLRSLQTLNEPRIQLLANAVRAEINRQDHLPVVLSFDHNVQEALAQPDDTALQRRLNERLKRVSREADTRALFIIDPKGKVFASDDAGMPGSQLGRDLGSRAYFRNTLTTDQTAVLVTDPGGGPVRYYVAHTIRDGGRLLGVAVVRIEFDKIEQDWANAGERVLVTDRNGFVLLSSDAELNEMRFPSGTDSPATTQGDDPARTVEVLEQRGKAEIVRVPSANGPKTYFYQSIALPEYGWTAHRLAALDSIESDARDGAIIGATLSILAVSGLLYIRQRQSALVAARRAGAELATEVAERTRELRVANESLRLEVDERRRTEAQLRETQNSLVQAGKLAALGQMSAAIAHEINQPLAAIRTFISSTKIYLSRGDSEHATSNLDLINGLAERMANITSHLKTFARSGEKKGAEIIDIDAAIRGSMLLIRGQIELAGVAFTSDTVEHVFVRGHSAQLEQVIVNLLQNAIHALENVKNPTIRLKVDATRDQVRIAIVDNGGGIPDEHRDQIFDPFFTTKAIGKGLGLGLSISYGIVRDLGGQIHVSNLPEGGAEIVVELPRHHPESSFEHV